MSKVDCPYEVGQLLRHKPSGLVGKLKWLPIQADLPFIYIEVEEPFQLRQGLIKEFEPVDTEER